ncbi:MAG: hypothetical protein VKP62_13660 [Candidatus Sericytochromatia bacterium]|nr:hypothetical protein [Candidatus Sericytochromatia bacterium]
MPLSNVTYINGRNLRYTVPGVAAVGLPYLTATLTDHTPYDPLDLWSFGSYHLRVKAGRVDLDEANLNAWLNHALASRPEQAVRRPRVRLLAGDRLGVSLWARMGPVPLRLSARLKLSARDRHTVDVRPESLRVFGLPIAAPLRWLKVDLTRWLPQGSTGLWRMGPQGSVQLDLRRLDSFAGELAGLAIAPGAMSVVFGGQPDRDLAPAQRRHTANYAEVKVQGEAALETGIIRHAEVVITDSTPQDPFSLNLWDLEGVGDVSRGQVILPEALLAKRFASAGGAGFSVEAVSLQGTDMVVQGTKDLLGFPVAVSFRIAFSRASNGELWLTPHQVRVAGLNVGESQVRDAMRGISGLHPRGESFALNLKEAGSIVMPPLRAVHAERGRVVLTP